MHIDSHGNLLIKTSAGLLTERLPHIFQQDINSPHQNNISGRFRVLAHHQVAFALGPYDHTKPLIIDPTLVYQDNVAGPGQNPGGFTSAQAVAVDSAGNAYVTGEIDSDFEAESIPSYCDLLNTNVDYCGNSFAAAVDFTGTAVIYETQLGGGTGLGIAVDSAGNAYVAGGGGINGTSNAFQQGSGGAQCPGGNFNTFDCSTAFVAILDPVGTVTYATNLGGNGNNDQAEAIAVDSSGKIYITGQAFSANFPTTTGAFQTSFTSSNFQNAAIFVAKIDPTLSGAASLVYSTFLGGAGQTQQAGYGGPAADEGRAIAVDSAGEAYVAGETFSSSLATSGSFQSKQPEPISPFVAKFNASGSTLLWATYLGGTQGSPCFYESAQGIALDSSANPYVVGLADSPDFPTTPGAFQVRLPPRSAGFVTELNSGGTALIYSTFLGGFTSLNNGRDDLGCGDQNALGIALDGNNDAFVAGKTLTGDFPVAPLSLKPMSSGLTSYIAELNPAGSALLFSTYMPAELTGIALDNSGGIYVSGQDGQTGYNVANLGSSSAQQAAFVDKVNLSAAGPAVFITPSAVSLPNANGATGTFSLQNRGNGPLTIATITPNGVFTEMDACNGMVAAGSSCTLTVTSTGGEGTLTVADDAFDSPQTVTVYEGGTTPAATVSRSLLAFDATNAGSTSNPQVLTLASVGNAPLLISNISVTAGFTETNNCGTSLAVETSCQISVNFAPPKSGNITGTLEIDDNAEAPSKVQLTGGTPALGLGVASNGSPATIVPGQTATYTVDIYDLSGYLGPATVTCSGAPKGAACKASSPVTLKGAQSVTSTITVTTTVGSGLALRDPGRDPYNPAPEFLLWLTHSSARRQIDRPLAVAFLFVLAASLFVLIAASSNCRRGQLLFGASLALCAALTACGSTTIIENNGGGGGNGNPNATPPGTYTLVVTVTANGSSKEAALTLQVN